MSSVNIDEVKTEIINLLVPPLTELQRILQKGLESYYENVSVEITDCPNLKNDPYKLIGNGFGGSPTIIQVGGSGHLIPIVDKSKIYNINDIINKSIDKIDKDIFVIGAGPGPYTILNKGCEGIYNFIINNNGLGIKNKGFIAHIIKEQCILEKIPITNNKLTFLANLFVSEGQTDKVLRIYCKKSKGGTTCFSKCIQWILSGSYKHRTVGLGGCFQILEGKALHHVMYDFTNVPVVTEEHLRNLSKHFDMPSVLTCLGTIVSYDKSNEKVRLQHFHSFSESNWGGHYHNDTTPDDIVYDGIFKVAEKLIILDRPEDVSKILSRISE